MARKPTEKTALKELKKELESGELRPLYLLYGSEKYLLSHYRNEILKAALGTTEDTFNYRRYEGSALTEDELSSAVWTLPFGSLNTAVEVRDLDILKDARWRSFLEEFLIDLPAHVCLIFSYDAIDFKPDARAKLMKVISDRGRAIEFGEQERGDLAIWLMRQFHARGKEISRPDAEYMVFRCGVLMEALLTEVEKIAAFARGDQISRADIDAVTVPVLEAAVYDLCDLVTAGKTAGAITSLLNLFAMKNEPYVILSVLAKQFRQLYMLKLAALERPVSEADAMGILDLRFSFVARKLLTSMRNLDAAFLREAVLLLAETDFLIKSADIDREQELETLLVRLCERGRVR